MVVLHRIVLIMGIYPSLILLLLLILSLSLSSVLNALGMVGPGYQNRARTFQYNNDMNLSIYVLTFLVLKLRMTHKEKTRIGSEKP